MSKTWEVVLPITGVLHVTVDTDDNATERDAIEAALVSTLTVDMIEQWEAHKQICRGNVLFAQQNEAEAVEIESDE